MRKVSHVVLAEDNAADVFLVRAALEEEGLSCELHVMNDGEEVLRFLDEIDSHTVPPPAVIILDLNMPRRSGEEVLLGIRQNPRFRSLPVIIITSSDSPKDKERVAKLGVSHYFRKPVDLKEFMKLGAIVREVLDTAANG